ncbi:MAG TPA: hypothetical protein VNE62_08505 [Actinomycetota bacterium]|nr:hypothetical protein [Actinomycetota bacterium]
MKDRSDAGDVLIALRNARPVLDEPSANPESAAALLLLDRVTSMPRGSKPRHRALLAATAVAAVVAGGLIAVSRDAKAPRPPLDVRLVAAASHTGLADTGRAEVTFAMDAGTQTEQRGISKMTFAGNDLEMVTDFAGSRGRPGFQSVNRTVGGQFYLLDGPPERKRWYHDVAASGSQRKDLFSLDPRDLLDMLQPSASFSEQGSRPVDGERMRRLVAGTPGNVPTMNLGLGPNDGSRVTHLSLLVDRRDVVRRIDLRTEWKETRTTGEAFEKRPDGTVRLIPAPSGAPTTIVVHRSEYTARFYDLGAPVMIEAPAGALPVTGKG